MKNIENLGTKFFFITLLYLNCIPGVLSEGLDGRVRYSLFIKI